MGLDETEQVTCYVCNGSATLRVTLGPRRKGLKLVGGQDYYLRLLSFAGQARRAGACVTAQRESAYGLWAQGLTPLPYPDAIKFNCSEVGIRGPDTAAWLKTHRPRIVGSGFGLYKHSLDHLLTGAAEP